MDEKNEDVKQKEFYIKNPNILAYFAIENGKIVFDYDDTKTEITDTILLLHNTVNEFLKTISQNIKEQQIQQAKAQQNKKEA